ncbi:hypothetical protein GRF29_112g1474938 [Pseudopithomyces chartarum]|uniref:Uncharacterized protein n=1 Tax=Pseudopithomyces chartarum TaxID=1892770 RepID=A0AAN6LTH2_9PLEO|nr:hypothetical protein GRF29_112g1474938 [Pseudopithomyces chartarum]
MRPRHETAFNTAIRQDAQPPEQDDLKPKHTDGEKTEPQIPKDPQRHNSLLLRCHCRREPRPQQNITRHQAHQEYESQNPQRPLIPILRQRRLQHQWDDKSSQRIPRHRHPLCKRPPRLKPMRHSRQPRTRQHRPRDPPQDPHAKNHLPKLLTLREQKHHNDVSGAAHHRNPPRSVAIEERSYPEAEREREVHEDGGDPAHVAGGVGGELVLVPVVLEGADCDDEAEGGEEHEEGAEDDEPGAETAFGEVVFGVEGLCEGFIGGGWWLGRL